jgi:hypothetical protein
MGGRRAALGICTVLTACGFSARFDGTHFRCEETSECPEGLVCEGGFCGGDGDGDGGGGAGDDGAPDADVRPIIERACPGQLVDSDTFDFLSGTRWYDYVDGDSGSIGVVDGVMRGNIVVASGRVGLVSVEDWPLSDVAVAFRIPDGTPHDGTYVALELIDVAEEALLTIYRNDEVLVAEQSDPPGVGTNVAEVLYDATDQAVWRMRVEGGAVVYEVSPDALAWTELTTEDGAKLPERFRIRAVIETDEVATDYVQDLDDMVVCAL